MHCIATNHTAPRALVFAIFRYLCLTEENPSLLSFEAALISVTYGRFLPSGRRADMKARLENRNLFDWRGNTVHMCTRGVCVHVASYSPAAAALWSADEMKRAYL